jgi:hypothetical protein
MLGRFDPQQRLSDDGDKIITSGPVVWAPDDQGRRVLRIDVEFTANGRTCNGHTRSQTTIRQDVDERWEFEMNNNGMTPGAVTAVATARMDDGTKRTWTVRPGDPDEVSIVAP